MSLSDSELVELGYRTEVRPLQIDSTYTRDLRDYDHDGRRRAGDRNVKSTVTLFDKLDLWLDVRWSPNGQWRKPGMNVYRGSDMVFGAGKLVINIGYDRF